MHDLRTVVSFEFFRTIRKPTFWISVLAFPLIIAVIGGVTYFSAQAAEENEDRLAEESFSLVVLDESGLVSEAAIAELGTSVTERDLGVRQVRAGDVDAFFYYPPDPSAAPVEIFARDVGLTENNRYEVVAEYLLRSSILENLGSAEARAIITQGANTTLTAYDETGTEVEGLESVIVPGLFLVLFFVLIILLGNLMLTSTTEEKENRVIEIMLTTVRARTLIAGKIISLVLLGVVQIAVITTPVILGVVFLGDALNIPQINLGDLVYEPGAIAIGAVLFVLSFMLFTAALVAIGAALPTAKEAGGFFGVSMFAMFIPFYAFNAIISDPSQLIVKIFSFFPLTAPMTLMIRNAIGNLAGWEVLLGIAMLLVVDVILLIVAARAFQYGALEYSRRLSLRELFRRPQ